jgi:hypothetical protein
VRLISGRLGWTHPDIAGFLTGAGLYSAWPGATRVARARVAPGWLGAPVWTGLTGWR